MFDSPASAILLCIGFAVLLCISISDFRTKEIPNVLLFVFFVLAVIFTVLDKSTVWYMHIFGCAVGYFPLLLIRIIGEKVEKREVMGSGDAYLSGIIGLYLGIVKFLICGMTACIAAFIAIRILRKKKNYGKEQTYPFAPFFLIGYAVSVLLGDLIFEKLILLIMG